MTDKQRREKKHPTCHIWWQFCETASSRGDIHGRIQTDSQFHMEIQHADAALSLAQVHHHRPIVAAIRGRDLEEARGLICQHIKDFYRLDPYLLRCYDSALEEVDASFGGPSNA